MAHHLRRHPQLALSLPSLAVQAPANSLQYLLTHFCLAFLLGGCLLQDCHCVGVGNTTRLMGCTHFDGRKVVSNLCSLGPAPLPRIREKIEHYWFGHEDQGVTAAQHAAS
eukprot:CAMPEP_0172696156 /NCGR_PEP_ID=MMETSP1074-20121228/27856_1 /TAXON_ID=2916 /ORGANISM="Ceratium fusus, Strain PA161109" /LENGTH=109 /DNA_ID=CAMNT_0013516861 /DNA_START=65 /DNA_END=394 /DNA_ORIENTATION=+